MTKKLIWLGIGSILTLCTFLFLMLGGRVADEPTGAKFSILNVFAQQGQKELDPKTLIREENIYLCGDIEEVARNCASVIQVKTADELEAKYRGLGYEIKWQKNQAIAQRKVSEFCSYHRGFRHLGIFDDKIAIYQGPIGYDQKLLKIEDSIPLEALGADLQVKLQQSKDFFQMTPETQAALRYELEFSNEAALSAILENLDEMRE